MARVPRECAFALLCSDAPMFQPRLLLIPEPDGEYSLLSETETPDKCYSAGPVEAADPSEYPIPGDSQGLVLHLKYDHGPCPQVVTLVRHRAHNLRLRPGDVLLAFVVLDRKVVGWGRIVVDDPQSVFVPSPTFRVTVVAERDRPELTDTLCDSIAVNNTPFPGKHTGDVNQRFVEMGVVDAEQTRRHKRDVQDELKNLGWKIQQSGLTSGPSRTVKQCRESMQNNAT
jgi:hypothetical protein